MGFVEVGYDVDGAMVVGRRVEILDVGDAVLFGVIVGDVVVGDVVVKSCLEDLLLEEGAAGAKVVMV